MQNIKFPFIDERLLPTDEDVAFYRQHGWYVSQKILSDECIDRAYQGVRNFYEKKVEKNLPDFCEQFEWHDEDGETLRLNSYVSLRNEEIKNLVMSPIIGAIAAKLAGTKAIRLFRDSILYKAPADIAAETLIGWHVDRAYWLTCSSEEMLTAWIPLHDCNSEMGTISVIDGSHKWKENLHLRTSREQNMEELRAAFNTGGNGITEIPLELEKGQVSFHHCLTIHGSHENHSASPRVAIAVHMQEESNRYREYYNEAGNKLVHLNDVMCRKDKNGLPDYSDPEICPLIWN